MFSENQTILFSLKGLKVLKMAFIEIEKEKKT